MNETIAERNKRIEIERNHLVTSYVGSDPELKKKLEVALENIDETNKKATLILETDTYLMDFWIYSLQQGVTFSNNFCDFLPGKHAIQISFESLPKLSDFQYQFR
jgi:hypothetical protein